jgi:hypothetical protein
MTSIASDGVENEDNLPAVLSHRPFIVHSFFEFECVPDARIEPPE